MYTRQFFYTFTKFWLGIQFQLKRATSGGIVIPSSSSSFDARLNVDNNKLMGAKTQQDHDVPLFIAAAYYSVIACT